VSPKKCGAPALKITRLDKYGLTERLLSSDENRTQLER